MSIFTAQAASTGETIKLPNGNTADNEVTVTIGNDVTVMAQKEFGTDEIKRNKNGQIMDQWRVGVYAQDGTEGRIYVDKFALKQAIGRAFVEAGIEQFHTGDVLTVRYEGKEKAPSGFMVNKYSASVKHNGGNPISERNEIQEEENRARDEVRNAYGNTAPAGGADPWGDAGSTNWAP